jgi:hypothetical protein
MIAFIIGVIGESDSRGFSHLFEALIASENPPREGGVRRGWNPLQPSIAIERVKEQFAGAATEFHDFASPHLAPKNATREA